MKTELKWKLIQYINSNRNEKGFTLVELLVVIIIIGILAAVGLPSFLSQASKAKQVEARQNVVAINRTQSAFRSENTTFATTFDILAIGTLRGTANSTTTQYSYDLTGSASTAGITATSLDVTLKGYSGGTTHYGLIGQAVIASSLCETPNIGTGSVSLPPLDSTSVTTHECPATYIKLMNG